jgi:hypothetical protein
MSGGWNTESASPEPLAPPGSLRNIPALNRNRNNKTFLLQMVRTAA